MGDAAVEVKSYEKAIDYYGKMLMYAEENRSEKIGAALVSLSQTLKDIGRNVEALTYAQRELKLLTDPKDICRSTLELAVLMISANSPNSEIRDEFNKALSLANEINDTKLEISVLKEFSNYLESVADIEEAETLQGRIKKLSEFAEESEEEDESKSQHFGENICLDDLSDVEEALHKIDDNQKPKRSFKRGFVVKRNEKGETSLQIACIKNDIETVEKLLSKGHPIHVRDSFGWTPLHEAANYDFVEIAKILIKHGADINDPGGPECKAVTPLLDAAQNGNFSMIYFLLENGANPNAVTAEGDTVLDYLESWRTRVDDLSQEMEIEYNHAHEKLLQLVRAKGRKKVTPQSYKKSIWIDDDEPVKNDSPEKIEKISAGEDYKRTIANLKHRGGLSGTSKNEKPPIQKVTAPLLDSEEILVDDWLEDDLIASRKRNSCEMPVRKSTESNSKRNSTESNSKRNSIESSSGLKRNSTDSNVKRHSSDSGNFKRNSSNDSGTIKRKPNNSLQESENEFKRQRKLSVQSDVSIDFDTNSRDSFESNDSLISEFPKRKKRAKQSSLLKSGFTKERNSRSPSPLFVDPTNYLMKQVAACVTMNFSVLIDYDTYEVTITFFSDRQSVMENVMEEVKSKFEKETGCKAQLKISTWEGVELTSEVTPNFFTRSGDPIKLRGEIIDIYTPAIVERYKSICKDCKASKLF